MKTAVIGYPRIGNSRELKFVLEGYFQGETAKERLLETAAALRQTHWLKQAENGIDFIPSNDFSFYDGMLDTSFMLNVVPQRYTDLKLDPLAEYFAAARGYQGANGDARALTMKKWFNTNYHYLVPEIEDAAEIKLTGRKPFAEFLEAKSYGIKTKPVIIGPFTFIKLAKFTGKKGVTDFAGSIIKAYSELLAEFNKLGAEWVQFDEPMLVTDMTALDIELCKSFYREILSAKGNIKVLLQTYFGDVRDCYTDIVLLDFDGIGLDFVEGPKNLELLTLNGFPTDKTLFAGIVNGKNIWKNNYAATLPLINTVTSYAANTVISTSCSLLHVPYALKNETRLADSYKKHFSFAEEKLAELADLKLLVADVNSDANPIYLENTRLFNEKLSSPDNKVREKISTLTEMDFIRLPIYKERRKIQQQKLGLPLLPTTTIGSFPQTAEVRANRSLFKRGEITEEQYKTFNKKKIRECIALQEGIGLDVLVHGEFERNDMVEYFSEALNGFLFTEKAWVQSYGTRCVKPPIIWGDISRSHPITVEYSVYGQSRTAKPVKGMLTGPVTILNWSFPREDISLKEAAFQIALAIREEVLELEARGIKIIQIDEAALKEKLPLRRADWHQEYLDWAIPAFRLVHSGVKPETQIHTHMCYSEFGDIVEDIDNMDADVISFEASRSNLGIVDVLSSCNFRTAVGPGVYDIHSPRIPAAGEIKAALNGMLTKIAKEKLWVNPDCGLKTRGEAETVSSLKNLVRAAKEIRESLKL
jgi:5-methyltetrahydropteroyltriglutamate--homocysteine methyltransferase